MSQSLDVVSVQATPTAMHAVVNNISWAPDAGNNRFLAVRDVEHVAVGLAPHETAATWPLLHHGRCCLDNAHLIRGRGTKSTPAFGTRGMQMQTGNSSLQPRAQENDATDAHVGE